MEENTRAEVKGNRFFKDCWKLTDRQIAEMYVWMRLSGGEKEK